MNSAYSISTFSTLAVLWSLCAAFAGTVHAQSVRVVPNADPNAYVTPVPLGHSKGAKPSASKPISRQVRSESGEEGNSMTPSGVLNPVSKLVMVQAGFEEPDFVRPGNQGVPASAPPDVLNPGKFFNTLSTGASVAGRTDFTGIR